MIIIGIMFLVSCKYQKTTDFSETNNMHVLRNYIDSCRIYNKLALCSEDYLEYWNEFSVIDSFHICSLDSLRTIAVSRIIGRDINNLCVLLDSSGFIDIYSYIEKVNGVEKVSASEIKSINNFFSLLQEKEVNCDSVELISRLEKIIQLHGSFYSKFTLFKLLPESDSLKKLDICVKLWDSTTEVERKLYVSQLLDIFSYINKHLNYQKECLYFEHKICKLDDVKCDQEIICKFYFKNVGSEPVVILTAETSCGCTLVSYPKYPIKPEMSDSIIVYFRGTTP